MMFNQSNREAGSPNKRPASYSMKTWAHTDKSAWEVGPWQHEPDKAHWKDAATGLDCLVHRGPHGALCGYVGIPAGHPWHGLGYDDCLLGKRVEGEYDPDIYPDVHGGLTYAAGCAHSPDPARGICHVPEPSEPDDIWWIGFDCAHAGDYTDMKYDRAWRDRFPKEGDVYRDFAYVQTECAKLAAQVASVTA